MYSPTFQSYVTNKINFEIVGYQYRKIIVTKNGVTLTSKWKDCNEQIYKDVTMDNSSVIDGLIFEARVLYTVTNNNDNARLINEVPNEIL